MKTVLITGASRGIGREVALTLVREGWRVLAGVRDAAAAPAGTEVEVLDVGNAASIEALSKRLHERSEKLDALVNNAGVYNGDAQQMWAVNVLGPLRLTRALDDLLNRGGRIVNVTSGLGQLASQSAALAKRLTDPKLTLADIERMGVEASGGYGATKATLNAMTRLMAKEYAARDILVNATSPGWARTDMGGKNAPRSVEQGAGSVLWGVKLPAGGPSGGAFEDGRPND